MKVTVVPVLTGFADADIEIDTGRIGFTSIVTAFDVAVLVNAQGRFVEKMQVTTSLLVGT